jgi:hypothetical protein
MEYKPFASEDTIKLSVQIVQKLVAVPTRSGATCSEADAIKFMMMCKSRKLNPFEGDAFLIGFDTKDGAKFNLITAHQAFLKRAELHPEYDGMESGVLVRTDDGQLLELQGDFFDQGQRVVGAWARVHFKNRKLPMFKKIRLEAFRQPYGRWNADEAGMIVKCFDEKTEVLTTRGFERFANAEGKILQVTNGGTLEPTDSVPFFKPYIGTMIEHRNRNGNFSVTPNHDMPIALNGNAETKIEASALLDLRQRDVAIMPLTITGSAPEFLVDDNTIRLAAAYISDGADNSSGSGFCIAVSRKDKIQRLDELAMHTTRSTKNDAGRKSTLSSGRTITTRDDKIAFYFSRTDALNSIVGRDKQINHETAMKLSMRQARLLIDTWTDYDGHCPAKMRCGRIYTSRLSHLRSLELLAVIAGYSINQPSGRKSDGGNTRYQITVTDRTNVRLERAALQQIDNVGGVWCVTVPTHKIVVRRNGFSHVCHQCAEADALRSSFPTMLGGMYLREEVDLIDSSVQVIPQAEATSPVLPPRQLRNKNAEKPANVVDIPKDDPRPEPPRKEEDIDANPPQPAAQESRPVEPVTQTSPASPAEPKAPESPISSSTATGGATTAAPTQSNVPPSKLPEGWVPNPDNIYASFTEWLKIEGIGDDEIMAWCRGRKLANPNQKPGDLATAKMLGILKQRERIRTEIVSARK